MTEGYRLRKRAPVFFLCALVWAALAEPAFARKKPRNPNFGKKRRYATVTAPAVSSGTAVSSTTAAGIPVERLPAGRWDPPVKAALEEFIASKGKAAPGYDAAQPPVAVLGLDDEALQNDAGVAVFQRLVERADFKFDDAFWRVFPLEYGRQRVRVAYEQFSEMPVSSWESQPGYLRYRKGFFVAYRDMCVKLGRVECRSWLARLWRGFPPEDAAVYAAAAVAEELKRPLGVQLFRESSEDDAPVRVRRGLAPIPEIKDLCALLRRSGFDVWILAADLQAVAEAGAKPFGVEPTRVAGLHLSIAKERFNDVIVSPVAVRGGKVESAASLIGRNPALAAGSSRDDIELLSYGFGLRLLFHRGDPMLDNLAVDKGWLRQTAFAKLPLEDLDGR